MMKNVLFLLPFYFFLPEDGKKDFEGMIVYHEIIGSGPDSAACAKYRKEWGSAATTLYVGNGNSLMTYGDGIRSYLSILTLEEEKRKYFISPENDDIPYFDLDSIEKENPEECVLLDSTADVLGYKCNIVRYRDLSEDSGRKVFLFYLNDVTKFTRWFANGNMYDSLVKSYPLKTVVIDPGKATVTTVAVEIRQINTDSIFNVNKHFISDTTFVDSDGRILYQRTLSSLAH
ncbi:MAG TPA: hypothetical protein VFJ43_14245 [Bacteroidia bacterium]|nr:hypothetical protein [Bacteroidia bacterium]